MYTATLKSDTKDEVTFSRTIVVSFTDGTNTFDRTFRFKLSESIENMKRAVNRALNELNTVVEDITGNIDDVPAEPTPDQAELDRQEWFLDRSRLQQAMELVRDGVFDGTETQITNLQNKVKTGFKVEYLG